MESSDDVEIVKMSEKGQLVVPQDIRELANLNTGERFVAFPVQDGVLFKKVNIPKVKVDLESLAKEVESQFKKRKVHRSDVKEAVSWARRR
jgi:bifunctional DNA-binding transcriptional regulator/antitoxin component of YhaV-PrlF toxin-antitoxin module